MNKGRKKKTIPLANVCTPTKIKWADTLKNTQMLLEICTYSGHMGALMLR